MWEPLTTTQDTWDQSPVREMTGHGLLVHCFPGPQWSCLVTFFFLPWVTLPSVHISEHSGTYVWPVIQNAHPRMDHGVSHWNTSVSQCSHGYSLPNQPPSHGEGWSLQPSSFTWGPQSLMTPLWGSASIFLLYHGSQKIIQGWNTTPVFCIWPHYPCSHRHPLYHDRLIHSFMSLVAQTVKTLVTESFLPASWGIPFSLNSRSLSTCPLQGWCPQDWPSTRRLQRPPQPCRPNPGPCTCCSFSLKCSFCGSSHGCPSWPARLSPRVTQLELPSSDLTNSRTQLVFPWAHVTCWNCLDFFMICLSLESGSFQVRGLVCLNHQCIRSTLESSWHIAGSQWSLTKYMKKQSAVFTAQRPHSPSLSSVHRGPETHSPGE